MLIQIQEDEFVDKFDLHRRPFNFSVYGRRALYQYLTDMEDCSGIDMIINIHELCMSFYEIDLSDVERVSREYPDCDITDIKSSKKWFESNYEVIDIPELPDSIIIKV